MRYLFYLREYLFPLGCGGCGKGLLTADDAFHGLCGECRNLFETAFAVEQRCVICGRPLISEKTTCLSCRERGAAGSEVYNEWILKLRTIFPYTGTLKKILGAYKFGKSVSLGNSFVRCLDSVQKDFGLSAGEQAAWVPVPPRPGKIRKQGWDQIEYLAGLLEREYKHFRGHKKESDSFPVRFPVCRCLKRLPSRSQKELNREERGSNIKGRILCTKQPPGTAVVFDDVYTTGATMNACAKALHEGGAKKVYGVCLFYD